MATRSRKQRDPFEVDLSVEEKDELATFLSQEIQKGLDARDMIIGDGQRIDDWHKVYEGGDRRITKNTPWPGAANLTSWIGTEKVDSVRARVVQTIFTNPIWVVEGWGDAANRVPFVEQFHQWKAEEERIQTIIAKVVHNSLIEGTGVLEVAERPVPRKIRERRTVAFQTRPDGTLIATPDGQPIPMLDESGNPIPPPPDTPEHAIGRMVRERIGKVRGGPQYRVLSLKDYVHLPGHAQDRADIWAYAKRFYKRIPDLKAMEKLGVYANVDKLGTESDREIKSEHTREGVSIADQTGRTAEKELWEVLFLYDFDEDGVEEWYVATLSFKSVKPTLLRIQHDDLGQARYFLFTPFPHPHFVYGYSLIGHKLSSIIDEHTAWRNMIADRSHLVINAPLKRVFGSIWNPKAEPWGPGRIIPVRDRNDIEAMVIPDVPSSSIQREGTVLSASERVSGLVDQNSGVTPMEDRTLGEVRYVGTQSLIRIEEIVQNLREPMEDLWGVRHEIWKRTLRDNPEPFPTGLQAALELRGLSLPPGEIDANMLEGTFRGKPHGSIDTADPTRMKQDFTGFLTAMTQFAQAVPTFGMVLNDPEVAKGILSQSMRAYKWEMRGAIERAFDRVVQMQKQMKERQHLAAQMGMRPDAQPQDEQER